MSLFDQLRGPLVTSKSGPSPWRRSMGGEPDIRAPRCIQLTGGRYAYELEVRIFRSDGLTDDPQGLCATQLQPIRIDQPRVGIAGPVMDRTIEILFDRINGDSGGLASALSTLREREHLLLPIPFVTLPVAIAVLLISERRT